ncbi:reverse transcriptase family protein [uncultured Mobiluncus sp.]|uniref:reverse transcriptase family protein n=1 Tax=uncultured Mobiluncus sp. TaxID=293425 RepID=UPI0025FC9DDB|nr:reverse transcriptase family protein [uncultured Mobiluncus sp.]
MALPPFRLSTRPVQLFSLRHLIASFNRDNPDLCIDYKTARRAVASHCSYESYGKGLPPGGASLTYWTHRAAKHAGGYRLISEPSPPLKSLQRWILDHCFTDGMVHSAAFAYLPKHNIQQCAQVHVEAKWLVKFDLKDFFGSVDEGRVYRVFRDIGYRPMVAFELSRLTTFLPSQSTRELIQNALNPKKRRELAEQGFEPEVHRNNGPYPQVLREDGTPVRGVLPQGGPASGMIANISAHELDLALTRIAEQAGFRYSRYCDDLFFSAVWDAGRPAATELIKTVNGAVRDQHFVLNKSKTRVVPPGSKKLILGLQVDHRARLDKGFKRDLEYHLRGIEKFGLENHLKHLPGQPPLLSFLNRLQGKIAFAKGIEPGYGVRMDIRLHKAVQI